MSSAMEGQYAAANFPSVGRWAITALPPGWLWVAGFGVKQLVPSLQMIAASVGVAEDKLPENDKLASYIGKQTEMIQRHFQHAKLAGPKPGAFPGAEESQLLMVRHAPPNAEVILHVQTYVRVGNWIGIVTFTTAEAQLREVRPSYEMFLKGLRILPEEQTQP